MFLLRSGTFKHTREFEGGTKRDMTNGDLGRITNCIGEIADEVLRDVYVRGKYRDVHHVHGRAAAAPCGAGARQTGRAEHHGQPGRVGIADQGVAVRQAADQAFYNTSKFSRGEPPARANHRQLLRGSCTSIKGTGAQYEWMAELKR